jgi:uncharacterized protein YneR
MKIHNSVIGLLFLFALPLYGQLEITESIASKKGADILDVVLEIDTMQKTNISFKIGIKNKTSSSIAIQNPLLTLEVILLMNNGKNLVSLKNSNSLMIMNNHKTDSIYYNDQNKSFKVIEIISNLTKQNKEHWYKEEWNISSEEKIEYFIEVKYINTSSDNSSFGFDQYKPIEKGKYLVSVFHPVILHREQRKIAYFTSLENNQVLVTLN